MSIELVVGGLIAGLAGVTVVLFQRWLDKRSQADADFSEKIHRFMELSPIMSGMNRVVWVSLSSPPLYGVPELDRRRDRWLIERPLIFEVVAGLGEASSLLIDERLSTAAVEQAWLDVLEAGNLLAFSDDPGAQAAAATDYKTAMLSVASEMESLTQGIHAYFDLSNPPPEVRPTIGDRLRSPFINRDRPG